LQPPLTGIGDWYEELPNGTNDLIVSCFPPDRHYTFRCNITIKRGEISMHDKHELCNKIVSLYPDIGVCGLDVNVEFDNQKNCWAIRLKNDDHELTHHLESTDADACMDGKQCVSLGLEIAQLKNHIKGQGF
jgi:hypothetical protein